MPFQVIPVDASVPVVSLRCIKYHDPSLFVPYILKVSSPDQTVNRLPDYFLQFPRIQSFQIFVFRHMMRQVLSFPTPHQARQVAGDLLVVEHLRHALHAYNSGNALEIHMAQHHAAGVSDVTLITRGLPFFRIDQTDQA